MEDLSSAHVYLRLPLGKTMDDIPAPILEDCAQLVKANSIQGNKINNVDIVYTPHTNLKKLPSMEVGQVKASLESILVVIVARSFLRCLSIRFATSVKDALVTAGQLSQCKDSEEGESSSKGQ